MKKDDSVYLKHIIASLERVSRHIANYRLESFLQSEKTQDAVVRQLEIIGEATKKISRKLKNEHEDRDTLY